MYQNKQVLAIVVAAGSGSRMKTEIPKQFLKIGGETIIEKTVSRFEKNQYVDGFFVVVSEKYLEYAKGLLAGMKKLKGVVVGGNKRQASVFSALEKIDDDALVLVHDAARPYVSDAIINSVIVAASDFGAAVPAIEIADTVKTVATGESNNIFVLDTVDRSILRRVQTPQGFCATLLKRAYAHAQNNNFEGTDDSMLVEALGEKVSLIDGNAENIKITRTEDMPSENRVGYGFDVHKLVSDLPLYLGGEKIPYEKGLLGHSDADVLIHAIMDSILGAAHLGDIGKHFPDTASDYKGISSIKLLEKVKTMIRERGYRIVNIDSTVMCEAPKLAPFIEKMEQNIADALDISKEKVSVKATTTEGLGYTGRGEGIAASSVSLLEYTFKEEK